MYRIILVYVIISCLSVCCMQQDSNIQETESTLLYKKSAGLLSSVCSDRTISGKPIVSKQELQVLLNKAYEVQSYKKLATFNITRQKVMTALWILVISYLVIRAPIAYMHNDVSNAYLYALLASFTCVGLLLAKCSDNKKIDSYNKHLLLFKQLLENKKMPGFLADVDIDTPEKILAYAYQDWSVS